MSVKTVYVSKLGKDYQISDNFALKEMQCKDGSDKVLYSTDLLDKLEDLRSYGGFTIMINSGYRTAAYNRKIGGASKSQHIEGTAADIVVKKDGKVVNARLICCLCQTLGFKGIGYISANATHVDMRVNGKYRGDERKGYGNNVSDFYGYFGLNMAQLTALKTVVGAHTITKNDAEKTEEETMYKDINDVPEWGKAAVQLRIDLGVTDGTNLTESMVRVWTIQDREDPYIRNIEDVGKKAGYMFDVVKSWLATGVIAGDGRHEIGKRLSQLQTLLMMSRLK